MQRLRAFIIDQFSKTLEIAAQLPFLEWHYIPNCTPQEAIEKFLPQAQILVLRSKISLNEQTLAKAAHLQLVIRGGSGLEHIDINALKKRNIHLIATPAGNRDAVAEHVIGMLLCLLNNIARANYQLKNYQWEREGNRGYEIMGKTVGILGYGNTGSTLAKKLIGFGAKVIAYDKYKTGFGDNFAQEVSLKTFFQETDILSIHIPLDDLNYHFVDASFLNQFSKPIWLINTARGGVLDIVAALNAFEKGKILGMALDVFENEDLTTFTADQKATWQRLVQEERIILTPHIAGWTFEAEERIAQLIVEALKDYALKVNLTSKEIN
ncbi:MAG: NAD(P)-dependent oxidoreductase [Bacteroidia bacterium]|nr:phosphoglycerate dehydrogenase [Bacteroidia bacterium]MDW8157923.1 NAD(P)-dependent oxidoreductase [Bacteroidia bacterium]